MTKTGIVKENEDTDLVTPQLDVFCIRKEVDWGRRAISELQHDI